MRRLVDFQPKWWWTWQLLANAHLASGDDEGVLRTYRQAYDLNQSEWWAQRTLDYMKSKFSERQIPQRKLDMGKSLERFV